MKVPSREIEKLSPVARNLFLQWGNFLYDRVVFNRPQSEIHAQPHCERVLLYSLIIGGELLGDNIEALTALAHASVFHDSRRQDDYLDTGHGARAADYYREFCRENPDVKFMPEAALLMKYHDINDNIGKARIMEEYDGDPEMVLRLYDIFKDADALDRWRIGDKGLDPKFLRTAPAKTMTRFSRQLVHETTDPALLKKISDEVDRILRERKKCDK